MVEDRQLEFVFSRRVAEAAEIVPSPSDSVKDMGFIFARPCCICIFFVRDIGFVGIEVSMRQRNRRFFATKITKNAKILWTFRPLWLTVLDYRRKDSS